MAKSLHSDLAELPHCLAPPADLVSVVNGLHSERAEIVTLDQLGGFERLRSADDIARSLRRTGWLAPLRTRQAWSFTPTLSPLHMGEFRELRAWLGRNSDSGVCIGGKSAAQVRGWLRRPTAPTVGAPTQSRLPRSLSDYRVCKWDPQIPLDEVHGLPVWKPETLVAFMASHPSKFSWDGISDWLWEACDELQQQLLLDELQDRPRAAWMKTAHLVNEGERADLAQAVAAAAPESGKGPYVLGYRERDDASLAVDPQWIAQFEVMDYVLPAWWLARV